MSCSYLRNANHLSHLHLGESLPVPFNIALHLRKLLIEAIVHGPVLEIAMITFKERGWIVSLVDVVKEEGVLEAKGPVELDIV